jgi:hypothetical protein
MMADLPDWRAMWRPLAVAAATAVVGFGLVPGVAAVAASPTAVTDDTTSLASGTAGVGQFFDVTPAHHFQSVTLEWANPTPGNVSIRALVAGSWTAWANLDGDPSIGPDQSSPEPHAVTFTDTTWVGPDVREAGEPARRDHQRT